MSLLISSGFFSFENYIGKGAPAQLIYNQNVGINIKI